MNDTQYIMCPHVAWRLSSCSTREENERCHPGGLAKIEFVSDRHIERVVDADFQAGYMNLNLWKFKKPRCNAFLDTFTEAVGVRMPVVF